MTDISADVIVVGAGVAGALFAERLTAQGIRVAILEAGPRIDREEAFETWLGATIKVPESPYPLTPEADHPVAHDVSHWYRQSGPDPFKSTYLKQVGGTTWHWLGTCVRYVPNDFRMRSLYGQAVDWPITYDDLEPDYLEAEHELGVAGDSNEDLGSPRSGPFPLPPIPQSHLDGFFAEALKGTVYAVHPTPQARNSVEHDGRPVCCGSGSCIPICPVQAKYDATVHLDRAESRGARVHEQCTAVQVALDGDDRVAGLRFRRPDGSEGVARGRVYALAAPRDRNTPLVAQLAGTRLSRCRQWFRAGRSQSDGSSDPVELGRCTRACLAIPGTALNVRYRDPEGRCVSPHALKSAN